MKIVDFYDGALDLGERQTTADGELGKSMRNWKENL